MISPLFRIRGKVKKQNQRGKALGFPTANISIHQNIPEGIYISETKLSEKTYQSLTFVGTAKTFNEKKYDAETYILDFDKNIYNKWISINLIKKIRNNKKFSSAEKLIEQMKKDELVARKYFG